MSRAYKCPLCRSAISTDDVNVATDLALCRACGNTSSFSVICGASEVSLDALAHPPRGVAFERDYEGETVITYKRLSPALFFLIPFTALWSGLSLFGIYGSQIKKGEFDLGQSLFGIPFLLGTVALLSGIVFSLCGKWRITLKKGVGSVFVGVGPVGWTRRFSYNRETLVSMRMTEMKVNDVSQKGILIRTGQTDLVFGATMREDAKNFVAAALMREVKGF